MKFVVIADPHLAQNPPLLFGMDPAERLRKCVRDINRKHSDATFCVILGDLTDKGEQAQYRQFKEIVAELLPPVRLMIGNHDKRFEFKQSFPGAPVDSSGFVQSYLVQGGVAFLFLDTVEQGRGRGQLCSLRLSWIEQTLAEFGEKDVIVFAHHSPFHLGVPHMDPMRIVESAKFLDLLRDHPRVRHYFFGHVHLPIHGISQGIPFTGLRSTCHNIVLDLVSRDAIFAQTRPSYLVVKFAADDLIIHSEDFLEDASQLFNGKTGAQIDRDVPQLSNV